MITEVTGPSRQRREPPCPVKFEEPLWTVDAEPIDNADDVVTPTEWISQERQESVDYGRIVQRITSQQAILFRELTWAVVLVAAALAVATFRPSWAPIALFVVALPVAVTYARWNYANYLRGAETWKDVVAVSSWPTIVNPTRTRLVAMILAFFVCLVIVALTIDVLVGGQGFQDSLADAFFIVSAGLLLSYLSRFIRKVSSPSKKVERPRGWWQPTLWNEEAAD